MLLILANEAVSARRTVYFQLVDATDGITAETGEAGGQPQVCSDGATWTDTGIGTLTAIGNGRYSAVLTQTLVATAGTLIETRYKSANTAEAAGTSVQVVGFDPYDSTDLGLGVALQTTALAVKAKTDLLPASPASETTLSAVGTNIQRVLGLLDENSVVDMVTTDSDKNLLSARLRVYDSSANCAAARAISPTTYNTGKLFEYEVNASYLSGILNKYSITKTL